MCIRDRVWSQGDPPYPFGLDSGYGDRCKEPIVSNDPLGRAVLEEGHIGSCADNAAWCASNNMKRCECQSVWDIPITAPGELLAQTTMVRYRMRFGGFGECYSFGGQRVDRYETNTNIIALTQDSVDWERSTLPEGYQAFDRKGFRFEGCKEPFTEADKTCEESWWRCETTTGNFHTNIYVQELRRERFDRSFGLSMSHGHCSWPGNGFWEYSELEIFAMPYVAEPLPNPANPRLGVHCSVDDAAFGEVKRVDKVTGQWATFSNAELVQFGFEPVDDTFGPDTTIEECARACYDLGQDKCNGFQMYREDFSLTGGTIDYGTLWCLSLIHI